MELVDKFAIGGLQPIITPGGSEYIFLSKIEHIAKFIPSKTQGVIDPRIQRELDESWVSTLSQKIEDDFSSGHG